MNTHYLTLAAQPFEAVVSGSKTIESRLYDEKRQAIQVGDRIVFTNREAPQHTITVTVVALHRYKTFRELFSSKPPLKFGGESIEGLEAQINEFYSAQQQESNEVMGIEFKKKTNFIKELLDLLSAPPATS